MVKSVINNIVLIGSGNVACNFAYALKSAGKNISQIYSRTKQHAKVLAQYVSADYTDDISTLNKEADLYIIAVNDSAIEEILCQLLIKDGLFVHTAGSVDMNLLKKAVSDFGVIYPLQSLRKDRNIDFYKQVPLCIEANNKDNEIILLEFSKILSEHVYKLNSEQRKIVHLAAVFVNNFTGYLYASADNLLKKNDIPFDLLKPLINRTVENILSDAEPGTQISELFNLTGPAIRKDMNVINEHLEMLDNYPDLKKVYEVITENIIKQS